LTSSFFDKFCPSSYEGSFKGTASFEYYEFLNASDFPNKDTPAEYNDIVVKYLKLRNQNIT
jgi:hypothetical protein